MEDNHIKPINVNSGIYIPPFKMAKYYEEIKNSKNSNSEKYQRLMWDMLSKSIKGIINKINISNISNIALELFNENLIRARGLLAKTIIKSQKLSPAFTHIYACLINIINSKLPDIVRIIINRYIHIFQSSYKKNDKINLLSSLKMIAHLINQQVITHIIGFEIVILFLEKLTADSVELACEFLKDCGQSLESYDLTLSQEIFEKLRNVLHEGDFSENNKKINYFIEGLFSIRRNNYANYPSITQELDLIEDDDKIIHNVSIYDDIKIDSDYLITIEEEKSKKLNNSEMTIGTEYKLDRFEFDSKYDEKEEEWRKIKLEIIGENEEIELKTKLIEEEIEEAQALELLDKNTKIIDMTEKDLINLKKKIYLTIVSSIDYLDCIQKLLKLNLRQGQEIELIGMIIDCCIQERTYEKFYGLIAERLCLLKDIYKESFEAQFEIYYLKLHRLETNKLRNLALLYQHLLYTKSISWSVLKIIKLTEADTTTSSRIFIKTIFLELAKTMGIETLNEFLLDKSNYYNVSGLFIKSSNPKDTRFCINYFTTIGLGVLTEDLRDYLNKYELKLKSNDYKQDDILDSETSSLEEENESSEEEQKDSKIIYNNKDLSNNKLCIYSEKNNNKNVKKDNNYRSKYSISIENKIKKSSLSKNSDYSIRERFDNKECNTENLNNNYINRKDKMNKKRRRSYVSYSSNSSYNKRHKSKHENDYKNKHYNKEKDYNIKRSRYRSRSLSFKKNSTKLEKYKNYKDNYKEYYNNKNYISDKNFKERERKR